MIQFVQKAIEKLPENSLAKTVVTLSSIFTAKFARLQCIKFFYATYFYSIAYFVCRFLFSATQPRSIAECVTSALLALIITVTGSTTVLVQYIVYCNLLTLYSLLFPHLHKHVSWSLRCSQLPCVLRDRSRDCARLPIRRSARRVRAHRSVYSPRTNAERCAARAAAVAHLLRPENQKLLEMDQYAIRWSLVIPLFSHLRHYSMTRLWDWEIKCSFVLVFVCTRWLYWLVVCHL